VQFITRYDPELNSRGVRIRALHRLPRKMHARAFLTVPHRRSSSGIETRFNGRSARLLAYSRAVIPRAAGKRQSRGKLRGRFARARARCSSDPHRETLLSHLNADESAHFSSSHPRSESANDRLAPAGSRDTSSSALAASKSSREEYSGKVNHRSPICYVSYLLSDFILLMNIVRC